MVGAVTVERECTASDHITTALAHRPYKVGMEDEAVFITSHPRLVDAAGVGKWASAIGARRPCPRVDVRCLQCNVPLSFREH